MLRKHWDSAAFVFLLLALLVGVLAFWAKTTDRPQLIDLTQPQSPALAVSTAPSSATTDNSNSLSASGRRININTASSAELQSLPEIGPVLAERIIDFRRTSGPFTQTSDIMKVKGIGERTYASIRDLITVK